MPIKLKPLTQITATPVGGPSLPSALAILPNTPGSLMEKPANCGRCKYQNVGAGFCPDDDPEGKKYLFLLPTPTKGEIMDQRGWAGPQGWLYMTKYLDPVGIRRDEVAVAHVLRCRPPWDFRTGSDGYPTATTRRAAEMTCRHYDTQHGDGEGGLLPGGLVDFNPNMFVVSFEPQKGLEIMALKTLILASLRRAKKFSDMGFRVCVLFGEPALSLVAPNLSDNGGIKGWSGHWWSGQWNYRPDLVQIGSKRIKSI